MAVLPIESSIQMEPNPYLIDPFPRMEPEELRERRNALKLKTCPFCGGTVAPRWAPWLDGAPCWEIEHTDIEQAVAAKCPIEMGGYDSLEQLQRVWNIRRPDASASLGV